MAYRIGDQVEVCSKEDGFLGSYYEATVISQVDTNSYRVKYKELLENDKSGPLVEKVMKEEIRPMPPKITDAAFAYLDEVDAFDNDGWWVGKITGKKGSAYYVYFETTGQEIAYPLSRLKVHLDFFNGTWV
ncbi:hypothetical protein FNV43_RR13596 [Rhamnella rubrinervis]|uniref:Agenet domain-containing protein n=1 Tax=Rhamnella rubrinervis TaxID=2594499 RepID=A0A8K0H1C3_9ROSA|nr:hypothetical protein FNV43_RR13596 [Rhamnella rubrinervis]